MEYYTTDSVQAHGSHIEFWINDELLRHVGYPPELIPSFKFLCLLKQLCYILVYCVCRFIYRELQTPWHICKKKAVCFVRSIICWVKHFLSWLLHLGKYLLPMIFYCLWNCLWLRDVSFIGFPLQFLNPVQGSTAARSFSLVTRTFE